MDELNQVTHQLKFSTKLNYNEGQFYKMAESAMISNQDELSREQMQIILHYLVEQVVLDNKPKSSDFIPLWSKGLGLTEDDFVLNMFEFTEVMEAFEFHRGVGVLPDIWPYIENKVELRKQVLDKLVETLEVIDEATENEYKYFMEDLYLIEDDIRKIVEQEDNWHELLDAIETFEPDEPPKNPLQSLMAQANENARLMEQKNKAKSIEPSSDQLLKD